jgi:thymidylate synthase|tara:strand:- start:3786 stop:4643 length:858 start_codon:yes stop_codon:yes gene_type:complete
MQANHVFQDIIHDIINDGAVSQPRDMEVNELTIDQRVFDPTKTIADFTSRKFNWKYFAGELAWYMNKDRDVDYIGQFSGMWSTLTNPDSNEINSNYGSLLFGDQLKWVVDSLKSDKNTRQAIAFLNQPKFQFKGNKDFVCTMYLNFFIRDNKLNMKVQMRSNDVFYGLTFDAPFFSFIQQHVRLWLLETYPELELGNYYHCADNIHFYERHFELAHRIDTEATGTHYQMQIKKPLFYIDEEGDSVLTMCGSRFMDDVNSVIGTESFTKGYYHNMLSQYLNINIVS